MPRLPSRLPPLELIEANFTYDPVTGLLFGKSGKPVGSNDRSTGRMKVRVGRITTQVARIAWYLYYREDPGQYHVVHINGDVRDNRIENLQRKKVRR